MAPSNMRSTERYCCCKSKRHFRSKLLFLMFDIDQIIWLWSGGGYAMYWRSHVRPLWTGLIAYESSLLGAFLLYHPEIFWRRERRFFWIVDSVKLFSVFPLPVWLDRSTQCAKRGTWLGDETAAIECWRVEAVLIILQITLIFSVAELLGLFTLQSSRLRLKSLLHCLYNWQIWLIKNFCLQ